MTDVARPEAQASARLLDGLLERAGEREALADVLERAAGGRGSLVVIEGEAGVGKSTLLEAAGDDASGRGFARRAAIGRELDRNAPFGIARQLLEHSPPGAGAPAGASTAAGQPPSQHKRRPSAAARIAALIEVVEGLVSEGAPSARRRLLLTIDDAHWADAPSLRFAAHLADRLDSLPVVVVVALRPDAPDMAMREMRWLRTHPAARILRPQPLGPAAVEQLVHSRFAHAEPAFCRACAQASGGNPFLLRELLETLHKEGVAGRAEDAAVAGAMVPESVLRSVLSRLGRLPAAATALARAVAVLDRAALRHGAALADLDTEAAERAADALAHARILCPDEPLRFVHPLVAAAVYADLPAFARARGHRRVADLLTREGAEPEHLAGHLLAAPCDGDSWVVSTLRTAAGAAVAGGAPRAAARLLSRALAEPPAAGQRAELLLALARAEAAAGLETTVAHFADAMQLIDEPAVRARAALQLAGVLFARLDLAAAGDVAERGCRDTDGTGPLATALSTMHLIATALLPHRADAVQQVTALRRDALDGHLPAVPELLTLLALAMACAGDSPALVREIAERALGAEPTDRAFATLLLPMFIPQALIGIDDLEAAQVVAERLLERGQREGHVLATAFARQWRAAILLREGKLREAAAEAERVLVVRADGWEATTDHAAAILACARLDLGDVDAARAAVALGREPEDRTMRPVLLYARGRLSLAAGDAAAALEDLQTAGRYLEGSFSITNPAILPWRSQAALAMHRLGDTAGARRMADAEVSAARSVGLSRTLGVALRTAGMVADPEHSIMLLREAVALLEQRPARLELAHALCELGAALRRRRHRTEAQEPLGRALELAEAIGAVPLARRALDELHATGRRPRRAARSGPEALTAAEQRVAKLAARGLSNREIAADLFITTSTVQWHLHNAYSKLGISTRRRLAERLE